MPLNPEVLFPKVVNFCGIESGKSYYVTYSSEGDYDQKYSISGLRDISMADFNPSVHNTPATGKKFVLCAVPNGVNLVLSFYKKTSPGGVDYLGMASGYMIGSSFQLVEDILMGNENTIAAAKTYGCKVYLNCGYPQQAAIDDYTKAAGIGFIIFVPTIENDALESWAHIGNSLYNVIYENGNMMHYDEPTSLYYPHGPAFRFSLKGAFNFTDLDNFVTTMNQLVPSKPITREQVIKATDPEEKTPSEDDPSNPGGGTGGEYNPPKPPGTNDGTGGYTPNSEPVGVPYLPTGGSVSTGSIKSFLVSPAIVTALFKRLWNNSLFDVITWQKIIEEPLDSIVSLICVPVTPSTGGTGAIQLGNIDTEVTAPIINNQYVSVNAGSVAIPEYWASALDYSPYTKIELFIPGVGIRSVKPEDVIKQTVSLIYNFDVLTGNFVANVKCGQSVLYKFPGNMKATIPITSRVYSALEAVMKGAGQTVNAYATGAMTAESKPDATAESVEAAATKSAAGAAISAAINVAMSKVAIQRSGDISGSTSLLDDFTPYFIIHRPVQSLADNFKAFKGYPSNVTAVLSSLSGYTEVEYIHLQNISGATDSELTMIEGLLKRGVII